MEQQHCPSQAVHAYGSPGQPRLALDEPKPQICAGRTSPQHASGRRVQKGWGQGVQPRLGANASGCEIATDAAGAESPQGHQINAKLYSLQPSQKQDLRTAPETCCGTQLVHGKIIGREILLARELIIIKKKGPSKASHGETRLKEHKSC